MFSELQDGWYNFWINGVRTTKAYSAQFPLMLAQGTLFPALNNELQNLWQCQHQAADNGKQIRRTATTQFCCTLLAVFIGNLLTAGS